MVVTVMDGAYAIILWGQPRLGSRARNRQLAAAAAAGAPGCAFEVGVAVVDGLDLDVLVLVRVAQVGADVELEGDALVRADRAGRKLDLDDGVGVLLALLDVTAQNRAGATP